MTKPFIKDETLAAHFRDMLCAIADSDTYDNEKVSAAVRELRVPKNPFFLAATKVLDQKKTT